jgi:CheY-like chemotaxis protein
VADAGRYGEEPQESVTAMPKRVLVIEDFPATSRLVEVCLTAAGLEVETRSDGVSGLAATKATVPDLVVLDIGLPGMDGWRVLDHIRADEKTEDIPVLILTAHANDTNERRSLGAGADAFMGKPFSPSDLRRMVFSLLHLGKQDFLEHMRTEPVAMQQPD